MARLERLQKKLDADRPALAHDAETRDPSRTDLKALFKESSIMALRETANPKRPWVAYVRVKWHFTHADGREVGDAIFDYIYALDPEDHWIKADEPVPGDGSDEPAGRPVVLPPGGKPA